MLCKQLQMLWKLLLVHKESSNFVFWNSLEFFSKQFSSTISFICGFGILGYGVPAVQQFCYYSLENKVIYDPPGEGNGNPLQYSCLEKSHGWRSVVGYSPWGREESDMTERLPFHFHDPPLSFLPGSVVKNLSVKQELWI